MSRKIKRAIHGCLNQEVLKDRCYARRFIIIIVHLILQCDQTALMLAAEYGRKGVVEVLVTHGADVNIKDIVSC